jgi:nucleoside-diphosphate-sugar epimerase
MVDNRIIESDVLSILDKVDLSILNNKTILVTGASGLIGTYILYTLKSHMKKYDSIKLICAVTKLGFPKHLEELYQENRFQILKGDLTDFTFLSSLPNFDYIIHAAGYGQPKKFMGDPITTIRINTIVTDILLKKINNQGKFIFLSSSEVYFGSHKIPHTEDDIGSTSPFHPRAAYIEGKRTGETICNIARKIGIQTHIIRASLVYGPGFRLDDTRVIYEFIKRASKGNIKMLDSGNVERNYCYISDAVEIIFYVLSKGNSGLYNLGGHSKTTILNLAKEVATHFDRKVITNRKFNLLDAPTAVELDMSLAETEFQKCNYVNLNEGLRRTIEWYKSNYLKSH